MVELPKRTEHRLGVHDHRKRSSSGFFFFQHIPEAVYDPEYFSLIRYRLSIFQCFFQGVDNVISAEIFFLRPLECASHDIPVLGPSRPAVLQAVDVEKSYLDLRFARYLTANNFQKALSNDLNNKGFGPIYEYIGFIRASNLHQD